MPVYAGDIECFIIVSIIAAVRAARYIHLPRPAKMLRARATFAIARKQPLDDIVKRLAAFAHSVYLGFCFHVYRYRRAIFTFHIFLRVGAHRFAQLAAATAICRCFALRNRLNYLG